MISTSCIIRSSTTPTSLILGEKGSHPVCLDEIGFVDKFPDMLHSTVESFDVPNLKDKIFFYGQVKQLFCLIYA